MRAGAAVITTIFPLSAAAAFTGSADTAGKSAAVLAKEVESRIITKASEPVRVETEGCRISIGFTGHHVTFLVPLRGSRIMETDNADGVVLINSGVTRKFRDRAAEPYERLCFRFGRHTIERMKMQFQQVIQACET